MRAFTIAAALLAGHLACQHGLAQSGLNNLWLGGFGSSAGPPFGGTNIDFFSGAADITYINREMDFRRATANITDSSGQLLFVTNGYYIADASGDTMLNGTGINPSFYTQQFPDGLHLSQSHLILPKPGTAGLHYMFHGSYDDPNLGAAMYLYLSQIDISLNGGLGGVVSKNQVLIQDTLNVGKITAVKHANGRDWWVFCHKINTDVFFRLLVTPYGVGPHEAQAIGIVRPMDGGQVCFSPDGSRFAYYWGEHDLDIFNFDRCTGLLADHVHIDIEDENAIGGVAFSPSSEVLYVSSVEDVYQYDMLAADIEASMVHVAEWDSFYSPSTVRYPVRSSATGTRRQDLHSHWQQHGSIACDQ
ncbi:MAG: hypothetical protein IPJ76_03860 [Flavobacteriales bacterium]|nr:MAG: hypothetical protein IPJ76_03860 [Flavobacteriales bacterium]